MVGSHAVHLPNWQNVFTPRTVACVELGDATGAINLPPVLRGYADHDDVANEAHSIDIAVVLTNLGACVKSRKGGEILGIEPIQIVAAGSVVVIHDVPLEDHIERVAISSKQVA